MSLRNRENVKSRYLDKAFNVCFTQSSIESFCHFKVKILPKIPAEKVINHTALNCGIDSQCMWIDNHSLKKNHWKCHKKSMAIRETGQTN